MSSDSDELFEDEIPGEVLDFANELEKRQLVSQLRNFINSRGKITVRAYL